MKKSEAEITTSSYQIPCKFYLHMGVILGIVLLLSDLSCILLFIVFPWFYPEIFPDAFSWFFLLLIGFFNLDLIHGYLLKKQMVELTTSRLKIKTLLGQKYLNWNEITSIKRGSRGRSSVLIVEGRKRNDEKIFGTDPLIINLDRFTTIESDRMINTVNLQIQSSNNQR